MAFPEVVSREQWLEARLRLLTEEKNETRRRDALNSERRRLPMVRLDKEYVFGGPLGPVTMAALFGDRRQLIVQHIMFGPDWDAACPSCTSFVDELSDGLVEHLRDRDTAFALVSRAPIGKIEAYRTSRGWTVPWYSSYGGDFNYDFQVSLDESIPQLQYNYRAEPSLLGGERSTEMPGTQLLPARRRRDLPHLLDLRARQRVHAEPLLAARPDRPRQAGSLGGAQGSRPGRTGTRLGALVLVEEAALHEERLVLGRHRDRARRQQEDPVGDALHRPVEGVGEAA